MWYAIDSMGRTPSKEGESMSFGEQLRKRREELGISLSLIHISEPTRH